MPPSPLKSPRKRATPGNVQSITVQHRQNLATARELVVSLLERVKTDFLENPLETPNTATLWGDKENGVNHLVKLSSLLFKLIPLEQELYRETPSFAENEEGNLSFLHEEDKKILEHYLEKSAWKKC